MRFEDPNSEEEILVHAQKDMNIQVLNNREKRVDVNEFESVGHLNTMLDDVLGPGGAGKYGPETIAWARALRRSIDGGVTPSAEVWRVGPADCDHDA